MRPDDTPIEATSAQETEVRGGTAGAHAATGTPDESALVVHEESPLNAETRASALVGRPVTPTEAFYVRSHGPVPTRGDDAPIRVGGLVEHPLDLSACELVERFEVHEVTATVQCAGNRRSGFLGVRDIPGETPWGPGATGTATWRGVRLRDVLAAVAPTAGAAHVEFTGADVSEQADPPQEFGGSIPLSKAWGEEVLLAVEMNGDPLTPEHGAPVRVVVPGYVGARSVKWVTRIDVRAQPSENFFQAHSYRLLPADAGPDEAGPGDGIPLGPVALNCDVLDPEPGAVVDAGPLEVRGYAYAGGDRVVARVDVSVDDGTTWAQAELLGDADPWTWRLWRCTVPVEVGKVTILARAWDDTGALQPEHAASLWNPKGYANNSWARLPVRVR
ncbi:sulfite oxidase [Mobilicoccus pelagius]|uniref:Putative sulfite oxidase n=1 Tax=Mobilicoccus pelagius NBRC 104925 TaxID=1089455 RepID=H5USK4_9MICO|nr:sulfite oxidase [Mobilicoccus pelagius]GAB48712.1 putative sulfite oxidase [Mobilicoccus pelagius NBRC 104925]